MNLKLTDCGKNEAGYNSDIYDCAVRASVIRFCTSYEQAHKLAEPFRTNKGTAGVPFLTRMGLEIFWLTKRVTVKTFLKLHPKGRYFVIVKNHAIGVKDGVAYDTNSPLNKRVIAYA